MTVTLERPPITHELKCWPVPFHAVVSGHKRFEHRLNDRDFRVGDVVILNEWEPTTGRYTGAAKAVDVIYTLPLPSGYVVMSIASATDPAPTAEKLRTSHLHVNVEKLRSSQHLRIETDDTDGPTAVATYHGFEASASRDSLGHASNAAVLYLAEQIEGAIAEIVEVSA